jgi:acetolactate synthase-1/2/3 large subunit
LCALAAAHGLRGIRIDTRAEVESAVRYAQQAKETVVLDFRVDQEDTVYPMVPAGAALDAMIRRAEPTVLVETASDPG